MVLEKFELLEKVSVNVALRDSQYLSFVRDLAL